MPDMSQYVTICYNMLVICGHSPVWYGLRLGAGCIGLGVNPADCLRLGPRRRSTRRWKALGGGGKTLRASSGKEPSGGLKVVKNESMGWGGGSVTGEKEKGRMKKELSSLLSVFMPQGRSPQKKRAQC